MLAKMQEIATTSRSPIVIGGLITSLTIAMCLENEVSNMEPIRISQTLDKNSCLAQKLSKD